MAEVRIATRESRLALAQARLVADALQIHNPDIAVRLVPMTTTGDQMKNVSLANAGGKGLFLKELETALLNGDAELAVHSMKDVPVNLPDGLEISAVLTRADARDVLITNTPASLHELPPGARIGTSSLRRRAQLSAARSDVEIVPLRGNVDTRLKKLDAGDYDAIVLALAGVNRLGIDGWPMSVIDTAACLPAVGQGAIGIECRIGDTPTRLMLEPLNDPVTQRCVTAERAVARTLEADCASPVAAWCQFVDDGLLLEALVATPDGTRVERARVFGDGDAQDLGNALAQDLLAAGAADILNALEKSA